MIFRLIGHGLVVLLLTLLTQLGGLAWLIALIWRRRWLGFPLAYGALWLAAFWVAPMTGREPLPCVGEPFRMQSVFYCATSRHYATAELKAVALDAATAMAAQYPGTTTLGLDAGFPFFEGFPMLPHLSHGDGQKLDLAFYYAKPSGVYQPGLTRSPIGYWAFEAAPDRMCPKTSLSLRWNMRWLQHLWRDAPLEPDRTRALIDLLSRDVRVAKIFVEPHLAARLSLDHPKLRFQGCRAARHDDHLHFQL